MKQIKFLLLSFTIMLSFSSCAEIQEIQKNYQTRSKHRKEIRTELTKYADILDLRRTEIDPHGVEYSLGSNPPAISINVYIKPTSYTHETLVELSVNLIDYFNHDFFVDNEMAIRWKKMYYVFIRFFLKEGKNENQYYYARYEECKWEEYWYDPPVRY